MTPIISPWVFYFMPICDGLGFICLLVGVACLIGTIAVTVGYVFEDNSRYRDEDTINICKKFKKALIPITAVLLILGTFIPSERTITKMLVAQNVTYERVEQVTDTVETVYNDIMDLFEED